MVLRCLTAAAAILLAGCGQQREATRTEASSPVVSAVPALDPEPRESAPGAFKFSPRDARAPAYVIPAGARVRVRLDQTLDTDSTHPGERFTATLDEPIVVRNRVVVPRGTRFSGVVVNSRNSGRFRGRALLQVALRSFRLDGVTHPVSTEGETKVSGSHKKRNLALMGGGPAAGAGIGAAAAGKAGALIGAGAGAVAGTTTAWITGKKRLRLPAETPLEFSLRSSVAVGRS